MKKTILSLLFVFLVGGTAIGYAQDTTTTRSTPPDPAQYTLVELLGGFNRPLYVTHASNDSGRIFVVEQGGIIWVVQDDMLIKDPFLDVSSLVSRDANERGLLGLAFHPQYAENGFFFIDYTDNQGDTVIARYQVMADSPNQADPASAQIIFTLDQPYSNHNGGHIAFGPDGYLYVALGDGGSADDPLGNGQNPHTLLGTLLRLDVNTETGYAIPADNPFVDGVNGAPEVWAWGLRNPWRFSFDRATGDLYIADVGQRLWEEVNFQTANSPGGENYGWNGYEGSHPFAGTAAPPDMILPVAEYSHSEGISVSGGYVYRGQALPDLQGVYFYADYGSGRIWMLYRNEAGEWQNALFMRTALTISSFGEDQQGELYVVDHGGRITRLEASE